MRYQYQGGPCLHCERPKAEHPAEADPPRSDPNGRWPMPACQSYTATALMVPVITEDGDDV